MTDKEQIIIDGVDVSKCKHLYSRWPGSLPKDTCAKYDYINNPEDDGLINLCKTHPNCYYKQLQKEKFENLNNRQMVESAENLIYENSELYKNLKEKEQECEQLKDKLKIYEKMMDNPEFTVALTDIRTGERDIQEQYNKRLIKENDRYRKALEKIEEYSNTFFDKEVSKEIFDIIDKAKRGE